MNSNIMKTSLNSDGPQFHHYHQSKQSPLTSLHMTLEFHVLDWDRHENEAVLMDSTIARSMNARS